MDETYERDSRNKTYEHDSEKRHTDESYERDPWTHSVTKFQIIRVYGSGLIAPAERLRLFVNSDLEL